MLTLVGTLTVEQVCGDNDRNYWQMTYHCTYLQRRQESAHHDRDVFELTTFSTMQPASRRGACILSEINIWTFHHYHGASPTITPDSHHGKNTATISLRD